MFGFIRAFKRRRLARRPFPEPWLVHLQQHVPFFNELEGEVRRTFLDKLKVFVWTRHFVGAGGMEITDEVKVVVAATAARLVLHLDLSYYDRLSEIVVYPGHYQHPESDGVIFGEANSWGTVVLSWDAVLHGLKNPHDGHETATHEFAHVLDRADGAFDGTPELRAYSHYAPWAQVMGRHYLGLRERKQAQRKVLRAYGAQNEAEFFAVATEAFFEKPHQMRQNTPDLFLELIRFYGFDPLEGEPESGSDSIRRKRNRKRRKRRTKK